MEKSEYAKCLLYAENRYQGYIDTVEDWRYGSADDNEYILKLKKMGYISRTFNGRVREGAYRYIYEHLMKETSETKPLVIYCDEDVLADGKRVQPFFKPPFSPDTLEDRFYLGNFVLIDMRYGREIGLADTDVFEKEYKITEREIIRNAILKDFAENYSREIKYNRVLHIPQVMFHNQQTPEYLYKTNIKITDGNDVIPKRISAVILSKDNPELLKKCVLSFKDNTLNEIEFIVVDNGSSEENRQIIEKMSEQAGFSYYYCPMEFVYSALCNYGAQKANGDYLLFLNDDVELPKDQGGFLDSMLYHASKKHAGAVGIRLLYPAGAIQHIGMTNLFTGPSHFLATFEDKEPSDNDYPASIYGYGKNRGVHNVMGVTGACLLVSKEKFLNVNGFDESIKVAYTDTDLCMDLYDTGYYNIVVNDYYLYHYESLSRGSDVFTPEKLKRLVAERNRLYEKHPYIRPESLKTDKYRMAVFSNPNLNMRSLAFEPAFYNGWETAEAEEKAIDIPYRECELNKRKPYIMGCIDRVERKTDGLSENGFYYEIEGWVLLSGKDQLGTEPVVAAVNKGYKVFTAHKKPRRELSAIFKKEKNTEFSGFIAKVSESAAEGIGQDDDLARCFTFGIKKRNVFGRMMAYIGKNR